MKFGKDFSKLNHKVFPTIRAYSYAAGTIVVCTTPTHNFYAAILMTQETRFGDIPLTLLRYDTDMYQSSREEILEEIRSLYSIKAYAPSMDKPVWVCWCAKLNPELQLMSQIELYALLDKLRKSEPENTEDDIPDLF